MKIGFDAKRAFQNKTGLGNYSRSLISILHQHYPENGYVLFAPRRTDLFDINNTSIQVVTPSSKLDRSFSSLWRSHGIAKEIRSSKVEIYHGVSNELPATIKKAGVKSVVTVHDLIFERYPETYNFEERYVHRWKIKYACKAADTIVAISKQTRDDLVNIYGVDASKITVCYQSCNPAYQQEVAETQQKLVKEKYGLPAAFFLFVSSIAKRKNLMVICKAMYILKDKLDIPLVVIGEGKKEKEGVKTFMKEKGLLNRVIFLNELPQAKQQAFVTGADFPAIYQQATALIYPSIFEGFGLPVLEALWSRLPVISSNTSSLPEAGGDAPLYFPPDDAEALASHMLKVTGDTELRISMKNSGHTHAQQFAPSEFAGKMIEVYKSLL